MIGYDRYYSFILYSIKRKSESNLNFIIDKAKLT